MSLLPPFPSSGALVAWDLDEVLANLRDVVCREMGRIYGVQADWRRWTSYLPLHTLFGAEEAQFDADMVEAGILEQCVPETGAGDILASFQAAGIRQVIVTARGWHPRAESSTWDWLEVHGMADAIDRVVVVPTHGSKTDAINALGRPVNLYVDDAAHHVSAALIHCPVGLVALRDRPWNRQVPLRPQMVRIEHLAELFDISESLGGGMSLSSTAVSG